jgi:hypothetical protein
MPRLIIPQCISIHSQRCTSLNKFSITWISLLGGKKKFQFGRKTSNLYWKKIKRQSIWIYLSITSPLNLIVHVQFGFLMTIWVIEKDKNLMLPSEWIEMDITGSLSLIINCLSSEMCSIFFHSFIHSFKAWTFCHACESHYHFMWNKYNVLAGILWIIVCNFRHQPNAITALWVLIIIVVTWGIKKRKFSYAVSTIN